MDVVEPPMGEVCIWKGVYVMCTHCRVLGPTLPAVPEVKTQPGHLAEGSLELLLTQCIE